MTQSGTFQLSSGVRTAAWAVLAIGAAAAVYELIAAPERAWPNLLVDAFYVAALSVSAMFFLAAQRATGARWSAALRRVPEAFLPFMPVAAVLIVVLYFGRHILYPWTHAGAMASEPAFAGKIRYLQPAWVFARMAAVLASWMFFAWLFRRTSLQQDAQPEQSLAFHHKLTRQAIIFVPVFALTLTVAAFDCLISTDPQWMSTMYAVYVFAGTFVQGIAAVTLATVLLQEKGLFGGAVTERQFHDLGKMLLAFTTFWAYIWVCQYLLIWYGNIPEEVTHYVSRTNGPWLYLFALNLLVNWVVPFLVLLPVRTKRSGKALKAIAMLLLAGHWLDLYMLVTPAVWKSPRLGVPEIAIAAGYFALVFLVLVRSVNRAALVPQNDPILAYERLHGATAHHHAQAAFSE